MKLYSENKLKATLSKSRHQYDIACDMVKLIEQGKLLHLLSFRPNTHVSSKTHYFTLLLEPNKLLAITEALLRVIMVVHHG